MAKQKNIWKFNDEEWKVHIEDEELRDKILQEFGLEHTTVYYESGSLSK